MLSLDFSEKLRHFRCKLRVISPFFAVVYSGWTTPSTGGRETTKNSGNICVSVVVVVRCPAPHTAGVRESP